VGRYRGALAAGGDQHEIRPSQIAPRLIGRHRARKLNQRRDPESLDPALQRTSLRPISDDREWEIMTAGGKNCDCFEAQLDSPCGIKTANQHCPATPAGPGMASALDGHRVDVFGS